MHRVVIPLTLDMSRVLEELNKSFYSKVSSDTLLKGLGSLMLFSLVVGDTQQSHEALSRLVVDHVGYTGPGTGMTESQWVDHYMEVGANLIEAFYDTHYYAGHDYVEDLKDLVPAGNRYYPEEVFTVEYPNNFHWIWVS